MTMKICRYDNDSHYLKFNNHICISTKAFTGNKEKYDTKFNLIMYSHQNYNKYVEII